MVRRSPILVVFCLACGGSGETSQPAEPGPVTASAWLPVDAADDPYAEYATDRVRCGLAALTAELGGVEVSTEACNYATIAHETLRRASAGGRLEGEVSWLSQVALEAATATLSIRLDEEELWTLQVEIPAPAQVVRLSLEVDRETPAGSRLYFHVRNHGYNTWHVSQLRFVAD